MDLTTFERLLAPPGQALLAEVAACADNESDLSLGTRLRRQHDSALVAAAVTQHRLRDRARSKFGTDAARMYFTHDALEQATRAPVATHRAERLREAGSPAVVDLGCGIGGDLIAFARAGLRVRGIDRDEVRVAVSRANLAALGLQGSVEQGDATGTTIKPDEVAFADPARRDGRGRTFSTAGLTPPWEWVTRLLTGRAVVKLMPGLGHDAVPHGVEAEWVSHRGDLVEACLWGPPFATATRRATVLPSGRTLVRLDTPVETGDTGSFLWEPDDAVIRAGLVGELAAELGGWLPDPHIAYITTDTEHDSSLGRCFRIVEELPFREKPLRAALVARDVGTLTIKKRGVDIVPEALVKRLRLRGTRTATVVMTRVDGNGRALLVEPVGDAR